MVTPSLQYQILFPYSSNLPTMPTTTPLGTSTINGQFILPPQPNTSIPNSSNTPKNFFRNWLFDFSGDTAVPFDATTIMQDNLTAIAYDPTQEYFNVNITNSNGNVTVGGGIAIVNNIEIEIPLTPLNNLNLKQSGSYFTGSPPTGLSASYCIYLVLYYDKSDPNSTAQLGFVHYTDYASIKSKCCLLSIILLNTTSLGQIATTSIVYANPLGGIYSGDYVKKIWFWEKFLLLLDGLWVDAPF